MSANFRWEIAEFIGMDVKEEKNKTNKQTNKMLSIISCHT